MSLIFWNGAIYDAVGLIVRELQVLSSILWKMWKMFEFDQDPQTVASRSIGYLKGIQETLTEEK
jgi:hypothetical protein